MRADVLDAIEAYDEVIERYRDRISERYFYGKISNDTALRLIAKLEEWVDVYAENLD